MCMVPIGSEVLLVHDYTWDVSYMGPTMGYIIMRKKNQTHVSDKGRTHGKWNVFYDCRVSNLKLVIPIH